MGLTRDELAALGDGGTDDGGAGDAGEVDAGAPDAGDTSGPACDSSPPSQTVDRYVWGQNFQFFFTPKGDNIFALYVPANSLVKFSLAQDPNDEEHTFTITIPSCEGPETGMGTQGNETHLDWKGPKRAGIYKNGGKCRQHPGMEFDVVVTP